MKQQVNCNNTFMRISAFAEGIFAIKDNFDGFGVFKRGGTF